MQTIIKDIDFQGFNQAIVKSIDSDGMAVCDLQNVTQDGDEVTVNASLTDYGFPTGTPEPFSLNTGEEEYLKGLTPREAWYISEIKKWLDDHGIAYTSSMTEAELLGLVPAE